MAVTDPSQVATRFCGPTNYIAAYVGANATPFHIAETSHVRPEDAVIFGGYFTVEGQSLQPLGLSAGNDAVDDDIDVYMAPFKPIF